jgi:hypothetical protein
MTISCSINLESVLKQLDLLPSILQEEIKDSMQTAMDMVRDYAQENHRYKDQSGTLTKSIQSSVSDDGNTGTVFTDDPAASFVYYGTKAHFIAPVTAKALHWQDPAHGNCYSKGHMVKGIVGERFLENAFAANREEIIDLFTTGIQSAIDKAGF